MDEFSITKGNEWYMTQHYGASKYGDTLYVDFNGRRPEWKIAIRGTAEELNGLTVEFVDNTDKVAVKAMHHAARRSDLWYYARCIRKEVSHGKLGEALSHGIDLWHLWLFDKYRVEPWKQLFAPAPKADKPSATPHSA
jgi:hypothetical protein